MLAPRIPGAFVCLRCELHRACPRPRPRPVVLVARPRPSFSTSARRHNAAGEDGLAAPTSTPTPTPTAEQTCIPTVEQTPTPVAEQTPTPIAEQTPTSSNTNNNGPTITRVRRRRDKTVSQTTARLGGLKQLGDDADILVIREVADAQPPNADDPATTQSPPEPLHVPDILASLQQEGRAVSPEDMYNQLESLRPHTHASPGEPHYVSQTTFVKLVRILTEGFTAQQLSQFYSVAKNVQEKNVYKDLLHGLKAQQDEAKAKHSPQRTDWHPGTTPLSRRLPGSGISRKAGRTSVSKPLLVDRILRGVWGLVLLEEIEAPGELELSLKPWQLALLNTGGKESLLANIGQARRAKLEVHWQHGVVRITADKNTAEYAANDVEAALRDAETKKLNLKPWSPYLADDKLPEGGNLVALYTQQDFDTIMSITHANVSSLNHHQLVIRGLSKSSVEEAERTLISLLPLKTDVARTIDSRRLDANAHGSYLLPTFDGGKSLDYTFRSTRLGRWSSPVARLPNPVSARDQGDNGPAVEDLAKLDRSTSRLVDRTVATLTQTVGEAFGSTADSKEPCESSGWSVEPVYKLSAEFGQVLFPLQNATPSEALKTALSQTSRSPFWPVIPGIANILTSETFMSMAGTEIPSLVYDFTPAPEQQNFEPGQTFPSLHIHVRTSRHGGKTNVHKINLAFKERVHDVLLPDEASDIRFYRHGRVRFNKRVDNKNITEWTDTVRANIESGGRLTAPSIQIDIPKWLLPGYDADAKGSCNVTYLFSGVQFQQTVTGSFEGTLVSYSTAQAGKLGANGGSLTSHYDSKSKDPTLHNELEMKVWVRKCLRIVEHITEAGSKTVPVSKVLNPRKENSGRKLRRAKTQDEGVAAVEDKDTTPDFEPVESSVIKGDAAAHNTPAIVTKMEERITGRDDAASNEATSNQATLAGQDESVQQTSIEDTEDPLMSSILALDSTKPSLETSATANTSETQSEDQEKENDTKSVKSAA